MNFKQTITITGTLLVTSMVWGIFTIFAVQHTRLGKEAGYNKGRADCLHTQIGKEADYNKGKAECLQGLKDAYMPIPYVGSSMTGMGEDQ